MSTATPKSSSSWLSACQRVFATCNCSAAGVMFPASTTTTTYTRGDGGWSDSPSSHVVQATRAE
jgi:hypothetical protein